VRVELRIVELDHRLVQRMLGVGDSQQKVLVAGRAADVGGRAAAVRLDQPRIEGARIGRRDRLDLDGVLPVLAEHVAVPERAAERMDVRERRALRRKRIGLGVAIDQAPRLVADAELERMAVLPPDRDLQHEV
jgi:hypothetical protein